MKEGTGNDARRRGEWRVWMCDDDDVGGDDCNYVVNSDEQ